LSDILSLSFDARHIVVAVMPERAMMMISIAALLL
jgi:hypothetical protein